MSLSKEVNKSPVNNFVNNELHISNEYPIVSIERHNVNTILKDYDESRKRQRESKPYGTTTAFTCRGCSRSFRSKSSLNSHLRICSNLKMKGTDSFFKLQPLQTATTFEESED